MASEATIQVSTIDSDIAVLTLDMPGKGANILSAAVLDELSNHLDQLEKRTDLAGLLIRSGKPGTFIAGADLREFAASLDIDAETVVQMCRRGQTLFGRLAKCPFVTVAAIDGICVGGGAELAIWCDRRVMSDGRSTQFGFPEVKLGLFPGWGGTARASRMIGLANAVEMITSGESVDAEQAAGLGLADDVVPVEHLDAAAVALIRSEQESGRYLEDRKRWQQPLETNETEMGFLGATASAVIRQQTKGNYPAPDAALELMMEGATKDMDAALQMEAEGMSRLFGTPVNAALLNVFFLTDRNKKDRGVSGDLKPQAVESVGVLGAGIMGSGIAAANVKREKRVTIGDASADALAKGVRQVWEEVAYNKKTKGPDAERTIRFAPYLNLSQNHSEFSACDLVIEAIVENLEVKQKVLPEVERELPETAILASNTSTIPISKIASVLKRPEQFCGIHFFNPVRRMQLVEVIRGEKTSDQTVATAVAYAKGIGKMPIVVQDGPGFLVNRVLFPYMNESIELLREGVPMASIERAAKSFGMPMGPLTLYDVVGLDTAVYAGRTILEAFPERTVVSPILPAMVKAGRLGQKSGSGFFLYKGKKQGQDDPSLLPLIEPYMSPADEQPDKQTIQSRLFLPMLLEATRILQEKLVRDPRDIDLGLIFGIGFPPFLGGLLFWADQLGAANIVETLKPLEVHGERFQPTPMLEQLAQSGGTFYGSRPAEK